jgi:hypothetical protein
MGSAQAEHVLRKGDGRVIRHNCEGTDTDVERVERVERVENKRTHETKVALLAEVTDGGGRFSTRPEEVE